MPGKAIRMLGDKTLIEHSLNIAAQSELVDGYVVSTDSEKIIEVVKAAGYTIEFKRPDELAAPHVGRVDAIKHAVKFMGDTHNEQFDIIVDLGVATPLKSVDDLEGCIRMLVDEEADNIISVVPSSRNPYYNMLEIVDGLVQKVKKFEKMLSMRQKAPDVFDMNDAFNVWWHDNLFKENPLYSKNTMLFVMPRERSVDIDEEIDFCIADAVIQKLQEE